MSDHTDREASARTIRNATAEWSDREKSFWASACDAEAEATQLAHQLSVLVRETEAKDAAAVRRRADVALATFVRLREYLGRVQEHLP